MMFFSVTRSDEHRLRQREPRRCGLWWGEHLSAHSCCWPLLLLSWVEFQNRLLCTSGPFVGWPVGLVEHGTRLVSPGCVHLHHPGGACTRTQTSNAGVTSSVDAVIANWVMEAWEARLSPSHPSQFAAKWEHGELAVVQRRWLALTGHLCGIKTFTSPWPPFVLALQQPPWMTLVVLVQYFPYCCSCNNPVFLEAASGAATHQSSAFDLSVIDL